MTFEELMGCHAGNRRVYDDLLERFKAKRVVPLFGAGMSFWAGYPGWKKLLRELCGKDAELKAAVKAKLAANDYEGAAGLIEAKKPTFRRMLANRFGETELDEARRPAYQRLFPRLFRGVMLTTNFERAIEPLYREPGMDVVNPADEYEAEAIDRALQGTGKPTLLKLHGDVKSSRHIVLTTKDYDGAYGKNPERPNGKKPMPRYLDKVFSSNAVLFLGASLQADRTVKMLQCYSANRGLTHFAVMPLSKGGKARKDLKDWGVEAIWYPHGEHDAAHEALFERLADDLGSRETDDTAFLPVNELVGREREVGDVREFWAAHQGPPAPLVWVSGPGGIGKTEFCKAVCVKLAGRKRQKVFVPMANLTTLEGFYGEVLKALGHDPAKIRPGELAAESAKALAGFCAHGIAYFDNAEDLWGRLDAKGKAAWMEWLKGIRAAGVGVVVSSREATPFAGRANCKEWDLKPLSDEAARALFNAVWGRKPEDYEADDYNWLIKQLEGYPLAIVLVAQRTRAVGYLDREGWERAAVEAAPDGERHTSMEIALRASWEAIRGEPQAVALWGFFHLSVVPLSVEVLAGLLGGKPPNAGLGKLRSLGLAHRVDGGGAVRFDMLNPIKQQFKALSGKKADDAVKAMRMLWLAYLRDLLPRADQTGVPREKRVPYEQECAARRTVHGLLPQVWRLLGDLCAAGEADAAAALMGLAGNFFQHDVNSAATLEALRDFFQGKAERRQDFALANVLLGKVRRMRDENGAAEEAYNAAAAICRGIGDRLGEANALVGLGHVRRARGENGAAAEAFGAALAICRETGDRLGEANALLGLGHVRRLRGEYGAAEEAYNAAAAIYKEIGSRQGEANALVGLGYVRRARGEDGAAEEAYNAAAAIYREIGGRLGEANALVGLGHVRRLRGECDKAEKAFGEALAIYREIGDRLGEANALQGLGAARLLRDEYGAAEEAYNAALAICREIGYRQGEANALDGLGAARLVQGEYDKAEEAYSAAAAIYRKIGKRQGEANALWGIGFVSALQGKLDAAEKTLGEAKRIAEEIQHRWGRGAVLRGMGEVWKRRGNWGKAEEHYNAALAVFKELESTDDMADVRIGLGEVYEAKGDKAAALREYEAALQISEAIGYKAGCEVARKKVEELRG